MVKSVGVSHDPKREISRLENLPEEILQDIYTRVPIKGYISSQATCHYMQNVLSRGPSWEAHAHNLLPGLKGLKNLEEYTDVIKQQYAIRANIDKGECKIIDVVKHRSQIKKVVFAEQPTTHGDYTLISASDEKVCVTHVRPNARTRDGGSFPLVTYGGPTDLAVTANGEHVALAMLDLGALLLRTDNLAASPKYFAPSAIYGKTNLISFLPAGTHVITGSGEPARLLVWDVKNLEVPICKVSNSQKMTQFYYHGLQVSPNGQSILTWDEPPEGQGAVHLWPNWREKPKKSIIVQDAHHARTGQKPHSGPLVDASYSLDGTIVTASSDNTINMYSTDDPHNCVLVKQIRDVKKCFGDNDSVCRKEICSAQLTDDKCFLFTMTTNMLGLDGAIQSWNMQKTTPQPRLQREPDFPVSKNYTAISRLTRNNRWLASGDFDGNVIIVDYADEVSPVG